MISKAVWQTVSDLILAEVMGEMALKQSKSDEVRKFAQRMIDDHGKARDTLLNVAKSMKVAVVEGTSPTKRERMDQLSKLEGTNFDREYMRYMVEDHEKAHKLFERGAKEVKDARLKEFAGKTVPTIHEHHEMAKKIRDSLEKQK